MALVFYNKGMFEKVTTQRTQQFSDLSILSKERKNLERTQLNATHAQLLKKLRPIAFCRNLPISNDPVVRFQEIWQKIVQKPRE